MRDNGIATVAFADGLHSVEAVKRASYALMARVTVSVEIDADQVSCLLEPVPGEDLERLIQDFRREVLDQDLRLDIEAKTEPLRNLILGLAFSRVSTNV